MKLYTYNLENKKIENECTLQLPSNGQDWNEGMTLSFDQNKVFLLGSYINTNNESHLFVNEISTGKSLYEGKINKKGMIRRTSFILMKSKLIGNKRLIRNIYVSNFLFLIII